MLGEYRLTNRWYVTLRTDALRATQFRRKPDKKGYQHE